MTRQSYKYIHDTRGMLKLSILIYDIIYTLFIDRHILYFIYKDTLNWNDSSLTVKCQYRFICVHVAVNIYFSAKTKNCCFSNENVTCNLTYSINLFLSLCNLLNNLRFRLITSFLILCSTACTITALFLWQQFML